MYYYYLVFLLVITSTLSAGCQDQSWTQITPYDQEQLDEERQDYVNRGLIISRDAWIELEIEEVKSPEDFAEILTILPNGVETRYNEASSRSIFEYAVLVGRSSECIEFLIDQGADIEQRNFQGETPLHTAVMRGDIDNAKVLLEHGADPNASDIYGYTTIFKCVTNTTPEKLMGLS